MTLPTASDSPQPGLLRDKLDWLLLLAGLSLLPWVVIYCADFWLRTDYRFFPILLVAPLVMVLWRGKLQGAVGPARWWCSWGLWGGSGLLAVAAGLLFSPWLAMLALMLAWLGWTLLRLAIIPWTKVVSWTLPAMSLLALPLSDATDPSFGFTASVTDAASSVLDLLGIPQMPTEMGLELRSGRLDVSRVCQGLGNPYLLAGLTVLLCLVTRPSFLVCVLTVASVPLWAWGGLVLLISVGSVLAEMFKLYLLVGYRLWGAQVVVLASNLFAIWLFQRGLLKLVSPFAAYSEGAGAWHKLYNAVVLWPDRDPLRKRKTRDSPAEAAVVAGGQPLRSNQLMLVGAAALLLLLAGGLSAYRFGADRSAGVGGWGLATRLHVNAAQVQRLASQDALPDDLQGMKLVGFEVRPTAGIASANAMTVRWTYAYQAHTVQLAAALPFRGFYPRERQWLMDGSELQQARASLESESVVDAQLLLLDELTIKDPLVGPSYLAYVTWSPTQVLSRDMEIGEDWSWRNLFARLTYQPTTASLSLFVSGAVPSSPEARDEYRQILMSATEQMRKRLAESGE